MRLQRRVEDLNAELIPLQNSRSETSETPTVQSSRAPRHQPTVRLPLDQNKLHIHRFLPLLKNIHILKHKDLQRFSHSVVTPDWSHNEKTLIVWCVADFGLMEILYFLKQVEVTRKEGKLEVRIECVNRPGLLVDIMGALESSRLTVLQASIACHGDILFEALSLEV